MHVDISFSYLRSAATASFDKKSSTGTAQPMILKETGPSIAAYDSETLLAIVTCDSETLPINVHIHFHEFFSL
jgi:hypothetical protein